MKVPSIFTLGRLLLLLALAAVAALPAPAQPGSGGPDPQAPTDTPLDGGASLLLASGLAYGLRRLRHRRRLPASSKKCTHS